MDQPLSAPKLSSSTALLKTSWSQFKNQSGLFISIMAVSAIFSIASAFLFNPDPQMSTGFTPALIVPGIAMLIAGLVSLATQVALLMAVAKQATTFSDAYAKGVKLILPYLWISILASLASLGGFIAFIIPGIIISIFTAFAGFTLVNENARGLEAVSRSSMYISGYFKAVLGRFAMLFIGLVLVSGIFTAFAGSSAVAQNLIQSIISLVTMPLITLYAYALYSELKTIKSSLPEQKPALSRNVLHGFIVLGIIAICAVGYLALMTDALVS